MKFLTWIYQLEFILESVYRTRSARAKYQIRLLYLHTFSRYILNLCMCVVLMHMCYYENLGNMLT